MMARKRTDKGNLEALAAALDECAPAWREVSELGDLIDAYFRWVLDANERGELVVASDDGFLRWAKAERRRRNERN